jgi:rod shape-determining protein MreC
MSRRPATLFVLLCLGHVLLISSQVATRSGQSVLHTATFGSLAWIQNVFANATGGVGSLWRNYVGLRGAARENAELKARLLELEGQLQGERARTRLVDSLEDALGLKRSLVAPTLAARVIAGNPMTGVLTINIDRGADDGVVPNTAVINGQGVVGRVVGRPSARFATVQLLIDRAASAGALIERSSVAGAITGGHADGMFRLELLSSAADVVIGDRVVTSGQDGIYPQGFLIGQVVRIEGTGKDRDVVVAPAVNFGRIDVVLLLQAASADAVERHP